MLLLEDQISYTDESIKFIYLSLDCDVKPKP